MAYQTDEKGIRMGRVVLHEDDLKITVQYDGESFALHYPNPAEIAQIETNVARRLGGMNRSAFPAAHVQSVEAYEYVDSLYIPAECPGWFKGAWTCYNESLVAKLFGEYLRFRIDFTGKFSQRELQDSSGGS